MKYRFLLRPAWLAAITALAVLTVAFVGLGMWQWSRAHRTHKLSPKAAAAYVTPAPLATLLSDGAPATDDALGHAVSVSGVFDGGHQLLVPDRQFPDGRIGYIVIAPLKLADGSVVVISRGWTAQQITPPAVPGGQVTVTGWLSGAEPADGAPPAAADAAAKDPAHLIASVDVASLVNIWPYSDVDQAYINALTVTPAGPGSAELTVLPAPAPPHTSSWYILNVGYTLQWWLFGVVGLWWFVTYVRRLANPTDPEDEDDEDADADEDADEDAADRDEADQDEGDGEEAEDLTQPQPAPAAPAA
ncbi:SURF1 family protein [Catenulispora sp. NL8]|uniref:SURF1-like protein n=1 Tax=Catenulispora pinistramenti TaxID=2705254 RepID=A0ABS5KKG0_9ACTN|nr:SURF1 family protein [Catenulispora pinistramenti]MBS2546461.1 SURF1 family protein [Catenulispora pinistramenti]